MMMGICVTLVTKDSSFLHDSTPQSLLQVSVGTVGLKNNPKNHSENYQ